MSQDATPDPQIWFRKIIFYSVLAGLCPLIPVPFLDEAVLKRVRRQMVKDITRGHGLELSPKRIATLSGTREAFKPLGCLFGMLISSVLKVVIKLVRRVFTKVLFVLALKEVTDTASTTFHQGYLTRFALERRPASRTLLADGANTRNDEAGARQLFEAIDVACKGLDSRPINQVLRRTFRGSRVVLVRGLGVLQRSPDELRAKVRVKSGPLAGLVTELSAVLWEKKGYLRTLETLFEEALAGPPGPGA